MYYKVLSGEGTSIHGGDLRWSLPTQDQNGEWIPGDWHAVKDEIEVCRNGLHLVDEVNLGCWLTNTTCAIYAAEGRGDCDSDDKGKIAFREARLLHPVQISWWEQVKDFTISLKNVSWFSPDGKPHPEWKVFESRAAARAAARDAAVDAAWDAARAAAWDAARAAAVDAAWDAARATARSAAWATARSAAWDAAWSAAGDAARDAAGDAARDAALYCCIEILCADLDIDEKHRQYARARWEAWKKRYGVLCDIDGVLYVYAHP